MRRHSGGRRSFLSLAPFLVVALALCGCSRRPSGPTFDIGSLIGKKLPEVEKVLGAGQADADTAGTGGETGAILFSKDDYILRVEYRKRSGRVLSYSLTFADPANSVKEDDKAKLLEAGGLKEGDVRYSYETIENPDKALSISGLRVTPAPVQHKVELRVKGSSMVSVRYTAPARAPGDIPVGDTSAPGQAFMTVPPWNTTFTAPTGTTVGIEAGPLQMPTSSQPGGYATTTVQIIADGKVIQQFTSDGGTAHCEAELD